MLRRYSFKLYPNVAQTEALSRQARMHAVLWNALLEQQERLYLLGEHLSLAEILRYQATRRDQHDDHVRAWRKGGGQSAWQMARSAEAKAAKHKRLTAYDQAKEITRLRRDCPEWRILTADSMAMTAKKLDDAFKAFFRRAKSGAGAASGYPRFRRVADADSIPFREMGRGWKITTGDVRPSRKAEFDRNSTGCLNISCGDRGIAVEAQAEAVDLLPGVACEDRGNAPSKNWRLYVRSVPGLVLARGKFPSDPTAWKNADIMFRDGTWWISICVEMLVRRIGGAEDLTVRLDLIDEFARVERADGPMSGLAERQNQKPDQGHTSASDAGSLDSEFGDRLLSGDHEAEVDVGGLECGSGGRSGGSGQRRAAGSDDLESIMAKCRADLDIADVVKADRDVRLRRGSCAYRSASKRAARISALAARRRAAALHRWTTNVVRSASGLTVVSPPVREVTRSNRGNAKSHGAAVQIGADVHRHILNQAPASAVAMLAYKAAEAGIRCDVVSASDHQTFVARDLNAVVKQERRARRVIKKENAL